MKIKRVSRTGTLKLYEKRLVEELIPAYLSKSRSKDTAEEVLMDMKLGCNNPFAFICVILDDADVPVGFMSSHQGVSCKGKQVVVDHLYAPSMGLSARLLDTVMEKLDAKSVLWLTYRDPSAWIKLSNKVNRPAELFGWMVRFGKEE